MQRRHYRHPRGPFVRRPGLPPFGRGGLLSDLIIGGLGFLIGRQVVQKQYQQGRPQASTQSDQLAQLRLLGELRESGVLTEEEFQEQKRRVIFRRMDHWVTIAAVTSILVYASTRCARS
jgi:hypothetical protein